LRFSWYPPFFKEAFFYHLFIFLSRKKANQVKTVRAGKAKWKGACLEIKPDEKFRKCLGFKI